MSLLSTIMTSLQATDLADRHSFALVGRLDLDSDEDSQHVYLWVASTAPLADRQALRQLVGEFFDYPKQWRWKTSPSPSPGSDGGFHLAIHFEDKPARQKVTIYCFSSTHAAAKGYDDAKRERLELQAEAV